MKNYIVGNWKMNMLSEEAIDFFAGLEPFEDVDVAIAAPYTTLLTAKERGKPLGVKVLAQNFHEASSGAYTGEIATPMIKEMGIQGSLIGHSERRAMFNEDDARIQAKTERALCENMDFILCIGESLDERESGCTHEVLGRQLTTALEGCFKSQWNHVTIAYEPVWAIGTGKTATPEMVEATHKFIREKLAELSSQEIADTIRILYGGSVKAENFPDLIKVPHVNGALIGGASLDVGSFNTLVQQGM